MLHATSTLSVQFDTRAGSSEGGLRHGISINDFYIRDGVKLGNVHVHDWNASRWENGSELVADFQLIVEDFPYLCNKITIRNDSDDEVRWEYNYPDELRARCKTLGRSFLESLRGICKFGDFQDPGSLAGHACGTCRSGLDPRTSVLDRDNRIHQVDNVYVVDSSFFPSSGGMNPALTIVANALRVSELISTRL
jgi:choline dehydrogenase-like flavoprotein